MRRVIRRFAAVVALAVILTPVGFDAASASGADSIQVGPPTCCAA